MQPTWPNVVCLARPGLPPLTATEYLPAVQQRGAVGSKSNWDKTMCRLLRSPVADQPSLGLG